MRRAVILGVALLVSACQSYTPAPLATSAQLASSPADVAASAPATGLTVDDIVRLALENDPDLRAARLSRGIAEAQLLQAGILPDPSLAGSFLPLVSGAGIAPAWSASLGQDIKSLITYRSRRRAGRDTVGQAEADLLWQEWQVAGQARQLAVDLIGTRRQLPVAREAYRLLSARNDAMQKALAAHDVTLVLAAPSLAAQQTARTNLHAIEQRELQLGHQLAALLGLVPDARIDLSPAIALPPFDAEAIRASLASLPERRPDLLALRLGYGAQDEAVRQAILSQFPDMVLGGSATSDSSKVVNIGPEVTIGLPIFDRGQGNIAVARATRAQLQAQYAARLAATSGEVGAALTEMAQLESQLAEARRDLPAAREAAARVVAARSRSAIDEAAFVDLLFTRYTKELDVLTLELALLDRQVALQTLLGAGLPQVDTLPMQGTVR